MSCNCINEANDLLREQGMALELAHSLPSGESFIPIETRWIDEAEQREKPILLLPSYCALCGEKIAEAEGEAIREGK